MTKTGLSIPARIRQETLVMAKISSQPKARGKSKRAKAAPARSATDRAKPQPTGEGLGPELKKSRAKTAERRAAVPASKVVVAPAARVSAPASKRKPSPPKHAEAEGRRESEIE